MKIKLHDWIGLALLLVAGIPMQAKVVLNNVCTDGMVLQQKTQSAIWGTASPDAVISVTPSWDHTAYTGKADAAGKWKVKVSTPAASYKPYTLTVEGDGSAIQINDVLVGEVWLASGQSNMQIQVGGFPNNPIEHAMDYITAAPATERIRMFYVPLEQSYEPKENADARWLGAEPSTIPNMSAVAFFYAHKLNQVLDVPVGIIVSAYGGSRIESWLPKEICADYPDMSIDRKAIEEQYFIDRPYLMYNAMLCPVIGYTIKGFIWYQGCSEIHRRDTFIPRMHTLVNHWREIWKDANHELPFYMVEIAPYVYRSEGDCEAALLRQLQHKVAKTIPNSGIVVTNDLVESYEKNNIHPAKKKEIGDRLAYMALNRNYGFSTLAYKSPEATGCVLRNKNEIVVEFADVPSGFNRQEEIAGLEVAGSDGVFYRVTSASMEKNSLTVKHEAVPNPCQVRYGWGDFNPGNLKDVMGLPVTPFWVKLEK